MGYAVRSNSSHLDYTSKSYQPFLAVGYVSIISERIQIGGKLRVKHTSIKLTFERLVYTLDSSIFSNFNIMSYPTPFADQTLFGPDLTPIDQGDSFYDDYKTTSLNIELTPFVRFFIWKRFGADLYLGG